MKRFAKILLSACIAFSCTVATVFADLPTLPYIIDFEGLGETTVTEFFSTDGRSYEGTAGAKRNFYTEDNGNTKLSLDHTNTSYTGQAHFTFDDFLYAGEIGEGGNTVAEPRQLVISYEIDYVQHPIGNVGNSYNHIRVFEDDAAVWQFDLNKAASDYTLYYMQSGLKTLTGDIKSKLVNDLAAGKAIKYDLVMDLTRDAGGRGNFCLYINGVASQTLPLNRADAEKINKFTVTLHSGRSLMLDNIKIYTIDKSFSLVGDSLGASTNDIPITTQEFTLDFDSVLTDAANEFISVKKDGQDLSFGEDFELKTEPDNNGFDTKLKVIFKNKLSYGSDYSINVLSDYYNLGKTKIAESAAVSFSTEQAPNFIFESASFTKGFLGGGATVNSLCEAANSMIHCVAQVKNDDSRYAYATLLVGLYQNDTPVSCAILKKGFESGESDVFSCALEVPENTEGMSLKAFVCGGLDDLSPYSAVQGIFEQ